MGHQVETVFLVHDPPIRIEQIGLVLIDQVLDPPIVELLPGVRRREGHAERGQLGVVVILGQGVVEVRVPRIGAVVGHPGVETGLVAGMCGRHPVIAEGQVLAHRELHPLLDGCLPEETDDVLLRSRRHCVPLRLILRVPQVEVVVVDTHAAEILRPGLLVEL